MGIFQKNYYASVSLYKEEIWKTFSEGPAEVSAVQRMGQPVVGNIVGINSSSIPTTEVDQFRQGVELTQNKHTLGMVKISAGTPGHMVQPLSFGVSNIDLIPSDNFEDLNVFNPVKYISIMGENGFPEDYYKFPIVTGDTNHAENYLLNGIIEPLTIRAVASFFSIEFPFESHAVKGTMMGGNSDVLFGSSDQILSVDYYPKKLAPPPAFVTGSLALISGTFLTGTFAPYPPYRSFINEDYYLDAFETLSSSKDPFSLTSSAAPPKQLIAYLDKKLNTLVSFDDTRVYLKDMGISPAKQGNDLAMFLMSLTGSNENYIPPGKKSATAGFVFDNNGYSGTDSIAFGGMTH